MLREDVWDQAIQEKRRSEVLADEAFARAALAGPERLLEEFEKSHFPREPQRFWKALCQADDPKSLEGLFADPRAEAFRAWGAWRWIKSAPKEGSSAVKEMALDLARDGAWKCVERCWGSLGAPEKIFAARSLVGALGADTARPDRLGDLGLWGREETKAILEGMDYERFWEIEHRSGAADFLVMAFARALGKEGDVAKKIRESVTARALESEEFEARAGESAHRIFLSWQRGAAFAPPEELLRLFWGRLSRICAKEEAATTQRAMGSQPTRVSPIWSMALSLDENDFAKFEQTFGDLREGMPIMAFGKAETRPHRPLEEALEHCDRAGKDLPKLLENSAKKAQGLARDAEIAMPWLRKRIRGLADKACEGPLAGMRPAPEDLAALKRLCEPVGLSPFYAWIVSSDARRLPMESCAKNAKRLGFDPLEDARMAIAGGYSVDAEELAKLERLFLCEETGPARGAKPRRSV